MKSQIVTRRVAAILLSLSVCTLVAQTPFEKHYGGIGYQNGNAVVATADLGFIATGQSVDRVYIVHTDANGDTLWTKTIGTGTGQSGFDVECGWGNECVVSGYRNDPVTSCDMYLINLNLNSNGDTVWTRKIGGSGCEWAQSVVQTTDDGFAISGSGFAKLDATGNLSWSEICAGWQTMTVQQTIDGGYVQCGMDGTNIVVVKTTETGAAMWTKQFSGQLFNPSSGTIQQTTDGGYIVAGTNYASIVNSFKAGLLLRLNDNGDTLWTRRFANSSSSYAASVKQTPDGGFVVAGAIQNADSISQAYLYRTDANGDSLWMRRFALNSDAHCVALAGYDGFVFTGTVIDSAGSFDLYLVKTNNDGLVTTTPKTLALVESWRAQTLVNGSDCRIVSSVNDIVNVYSIQGTLIAEMNIHPGNNALAVGKFASGMYLLSSVANATRQKICIVR